MLIHSVLFRTINYIIINNIFCHLWRFATLGWVLWILNCFHMVINLILHCKTACIWLKFHKCSGKCWLIKFIITYCLGIQTTKQYGKKNTTTTHILPYPGQPWDSWNNFRRSGGSWASCLYWRRQPADLWGVLEQLGGGRGNYSNSSTCLRANQWKSDSVSTSKLNSVRENQRSPRRNCTSHTSCLQDGKVYGCTFQRSECVFYCDQQKNKRE